LNDFIISDVGGTTTDVAIVRNGWPSLNEKGAMAGGYRTLVRAIDMQTIGLGGDSEVEIDYRGNISLKPNRVVPVSLICDRFPNVIASLQASLGRGMGLARAIRFIFLPEGYHKQNLPGGLSEADLQFIEQISIEPKSFDKIVVRASDRARAERLLDRGIIQVSSLTPSDAAHVLGLQSQWSFEGARLACLMLGRSYGLISWDEGKTARDTEDFARHIFDVMVGKSASLIINQLSGYSFPADDPLVNAVTQGENQLNDLSISLKPTIPVVAVGGPAQVFYPQVGERLNVHSVIPHNADVTNAIGAAIGRIKIRTVIEITAGESGGYHLHHDSNPVFITDSEEALEQARRLASRYVEQKAISMGGTSPEIRIEVERVDLPNMDKQRSLIAATVTAECLSSPAT
jgi:N-methylhydantoinase A/oxoprolinase/acetone carboxylase beta subunit